MIYEFSKFKEQKIGGRGLSDNTGGWEEGAEKTNTCMC